MKRITILSAAFISVMTMINAQNPTTLTDKPTETTQTAGRSQLGEFAPKFAELNDDVLFGEV